MIGMVTTFHQSASITSVIITKPSATATFASNHSLLPKENGQLVDGADPVPNIVTTKVIFFAAIPSTFVSYSLIVIGIAIAETYMLIRIMYENRNKFKSIMYKITMGVTVIQLTNVCLYVTFLDYLASPYTMADSFIALLALPAGLLNCVILLVIYGMIYVRISVFVTTVSPIMRVFYSLIYLAALAVVGLFIVTCLLFAPFISQPMAGADWSKSPYYLVIFFD